MQLIQLDQQISDYCRENMISGVLRVTIGGKIEYEKRIGFADIGNKCLFTDNAMFTLYSLSKPFCALGLLKLKDKKLIDLEAHPAEYVPEAYGFDKRVTFRNLLQHTSGLPDFEQNREFAQKYSPGYAMYIRDHLKLLAEYPSYFAPNTGARYENINFVLCALAVENISGMTYADYMKQEVFSPLGMKSAVVDNESLVIPYRVKGYELLDGCPVEVKKSHDWMLGAGDIVSTIDDVYCLNRVIKKRDLLCEETWEEVLTPSMLNGMGMGCSVTNWHGKVRITHNGGHRGFRTLHIQLPEDDFDIILLSNSGFGNARNDLAEMIYSAFYQESDSVEDCLEMDKGYI